MPWGLLVCKQQSSDVCRWTVPKPPPGYCWLSRRRPVGRLMRSPPGPCQNGTISPALRFAARAALAFFKFASSFAFAVVDSFLFVTAFFGAGFSALAWNAAHLFLAAALIALFPAALNFRFGLAPSDAATSFCVGPASCS